MTKMGQRQRKNLSKSEGGDGRRSACFGAADRRARFALEVLGAQQLQVMNGVNLNEAQNVMMDGWQFVTGTCTKINQQFIFFSPKEEEEYSRDPNCSLK